MEFHDQEKNTSPQHNQVVVGDAQAMAGQDPSPRHIINRPQSIVDANSLDDGPTDNSSELEQTSPDTPDTELDPEVLTRQRSGPAYSVFTPGMKKMIITLVSFTSFLSPMTAVG